MRDKIPQSDAIELTYRAFLDAASEHFKVVNRTGFDDADKYCLILKEDAKLLLEWFEKIRKSTPRANWRTISVDKKFLQRLKQIKFPPLLPEKEDATRLQRESDKASDQSSRRAATIQGSS